ncbi:MAG: ABC transporter ATP-binding protein [Candidatus Odinarchaeota archaeon]|nr:ABC transporter ATP-binding protein [Candidatus Odinarchaeota archaeon]
MIRAENLRKEYKRGRETVDAIKNITLKIDEGEFFVFIGPSGSGKTTLLNLLSGLDKPTEGRVILDGMDLTSIDERILPKIRREKIGFVFQDFNLIENMTALENVMAPLIPTDLKKKEIVARATEMLRLVDLIERKDHLPKQMSGGEQQRVAIARALVTHPKVVFADEPTGNLDSKTGSDIMKLLKKINKEKGTTFVVVTHDERIINFADRVAYIEDGEIRKIEKPK